MINSELKTLNATGNGLIGNMPDAGTSTGLMAGLGADLGVDATNSMGSIAGSTMSCAPMETCEEPGDFTASHGATSAPGRMGSAL